MGQFVHNNVVQLHGVVTGRGEYDNCTGVYA